MYCEECGFSCNCEPRELRLPPPISRKEAEDFLLKVLEWEDKHLKEIEEELSKDSLTDKWKKAAWEHAKALRLDAEEQYALYHMRQLESDKYIEAINGARKMRYNYWHVIK